MKGLKFRVWDKEREYYLDETELAGITPDRLISFVSMPCYVVCEKCGHRGSLFTKDLDPYQVQAVDENIKAQNLRNLAYSGEKEE